MLFMMGKKPLPEVRHTKARRSEGYWAKIGGIFHDAKDFTSELLYLSIKRAILPFGWRR